MRLAFVSPLFQINEKMKKIKSPIQEVLEQFFLLEEILSIKNLSKGNINHSYKISLKDETYLLQRINTDVFLNPIQIFQNTQAIIKYIQTNFPEKRFSKIKYTKDGNIYYLSSKQEYWRMMVWIENSVSYTSPKNKSQAIEAGKALADFHNSLVKFPVYSLFETFPNFHNTKYRFEQFQNAIEYDSANRVIDVKNEINFLLEKHQLSGIIQSLIIQNLIPIRITHNDPKMDNILLDQGTEKEICLIDLDTIMPGTILFDFGDMIRTCAVTASENETDLSKVDIDLNLFKGCVEGYASIANQFITNIEKAHLFLGALTIAYEQALRFLTDYLNGDQYYKIAYAEHNLERAKNQIKLVKSLENHQSQLEDIIHKFFNP